MIQLEVWGNYALLSRPELKVERVSYEVLTPSAARGIVEAIYYHPGLRWKIRKIYVMNPIRFTNIRRNEVKSKILCSDVRSAMQGTGKELYLATPQQIVQRVAVPQPVKADVVAPALRADGDVFSAPVNGEAVLFQQAQQLLQAGRFLLQGSVFSYSLSWVP